MHHANFHFDVKRLSETGEIEGLAAGYGNTDSHGDIFAAGAFAKSIASAGEGGRMPAMLLHHDVNRPVGRWTDLAEKSDGLWVRGSLALDASDGREAYALLKNGALAGLSVGFRPVKSKARAGGDLITEAELFEISLVSVPSNPLTRITSVKGVGSVRDLEELLRAGGMSARQAKQAAGAAFRVAETPEEPVVGERALRRFAADIETLKSFGRK